MRAAANLANRRLSATHAVVLGKTTQRGVAVVEAHNLREVDRALRARFFIHAAPPPFA
jgi:hypothetical protein